jgi:hypothetical protein
VTAVLAGALFLVISLLAAAQLQLRGDIRGLGDKIGTLGRDLSALIANLRVDMATIGQKLDDHCAGPHAHTP